MQALNDKLAELQAVLAGFRLGQMEEHVMPELGVRMEWALRMVQRCRLPASMATIVPVLCDRLRQQGPDPERLQGLINTLSLKCAVLSDKREWYAYEMRERTAEEQPLRSVAALAARNVARALRHAYSGTAVTVEVHSVRVEEWLYLSVRTFRGDSQRTLYLAVLPSAKYVFTSQRKVSEKLINAVAEGVGWGGAACAELGGRHLPSLLRALQRDVNVAPRALLAPPVYAPRPERRPHGVDFTGDGYNARYADDIVGPEPPLLRRLEATVEKPFCDEPGAEPVRLALKIQSDDVAATLRDLVRIKAISPDSEWLHAFSSTKTNRLDLDVDMDE